jgi:SAM-dependent methyltransferase
MASVSWSEKIKMPNEGNVRPEFDHYAPNYTELLRDSTRTRFSHNPLHFQWRKWLLLRRLLIGRGIDIATQRWLDVGCGQGDLLRIAGVNFAQAMGCDLSGDMLPAEGSIEVYQQESPVKLPLADGSVDVLTAVCVYHHVRPEYRSELTNEIKRVLSAGGLCCIVEHNPWNPVTRSIVRRCPVDVDADLLSAPAAGRMLQSSGLEILRSEYFLYLPESLFDRFGALERMLCKIPFGGQYALLARARV